MRIGFDAKRMFFNRSGLGNYGRNCLRLFSTFYPEHEYLLYTPSMRGSIWSPDHPSVSVRTPTGLLNRAWPDYWRAISMSRQIAEDGCQIFHGLNNELPVGLDRAKTRRIQTVHDLIFLRYPQFYQPVDRFIYRLKSRYGAGIADRIVADSLQTKQDLVSFFGIDPSKIHVIYLSCNPIFYRQIDRLEIAETQKKYNIPEHYALSVGTIERRKNILGIVTAFHQAAVDLPLVIIGKPTEYLKLVKRYVEEHGLLSKVYFRHAIATEDLPALYQGAQVLLYPSFFEGFGFPILEALYSRVPVITSRDGCFREVGGPSTCYVDPADIAQIAEALKTVLSDTVLRRTMITDGLAHAQQFNEDRIAHQLMALYQSLV